jgi:hypothetical protein
MQCLPTKKASKTTETSLVNLRRTVYLTIMNTLKHTSSKHRSKKAMRYVVISYSQRFVHA